MHNLCFRSIMLLLLLSSGCTTAEFRHGGLYMKNPGSIPVTTSKHPQETAITIAPRFLGFNFKF